MSLVAVGPAIEWFRLSPVIVLAVGAMGLLLVSALVRPWRSGWYAISAASIAGAAGVLLALSWTEASTPSTLVGGVLAFDRHGLIASVAIVVATLLSILVANDRLVETGDDAAEPYALMLAAAIGAVVMVTATELIVLFIGLETMSLAFYLLSASDRRDPRSGEAGLKYFILGGFASAFLLFGIALVYGATGETRLSSVAEALRSGVTVPESDALLVAGVGLLIVGFAFKAALVPFHVWTPDVYQGAPTQVTAFLASVGKVAAFVAILRVVADSLSARADDWRPVVWVLAAVTVSIGAVLALVQDDVKRMLAYSSISHAGFILVGVEAAGGSSTVGSEAVLGYVVLYVPLVVGTLAAIGVVGRSPAVADLDGLGKRSPRVAIALTVLLLAQAGVPLTAGFVAKFGVVRAAVEAGSASLAVVAMLGAVVAAYLYLRIVVAVWMREPTNSDAPAVGAATATVLVVCTIVTVAVGVAPGVLLDLLVAPGR